MRHRKAGMTGIARTWEKAGEGGSWGGKSARGKAWGKEDGSGKEKTGRGNRVREERTEEERGGDRETLFRRDGAEIRRGEAGES